MRLATSQQVVEESLLPMGRDDPFLTPLFRKGILQGLHPARKCRIPRKNADEEMQMIRHQHIAPDHHAMVRGLDAESNKSGMDRIRGKDPLSIECAGRDEILRSVRVNPVQATKTIHHRDLSGSTYPHKKEIRPL